MNCKKCGNPITPFDKNCQSCGEINELYNGGDQAVSLNENENINEQVSEIPFNSATIPGEAITDAAIVQPSEDVVEQENVEEDTVMPQEVITDAPIVESTESAEDAITNQETEIPVVQEEIPVINQVQEKPIKPKKNILVILLIVLGVVIVLIGIFIIVGLSGGDKSKKSNKEATKKTEVTKTDEKNEEEDYSEESIDIDNYTFSIPSTLSKGTDEKNNVVIGTTDFYFGSSKIISGTTYDEVKEQLPNLATTLINDYQNKDSSVAYENSGEYIYSSKKFLIVSFSNGSEYIERVITELNDGTLFCTYVYYYSKDTAKTGYQYLEKFIKSGAINSEKTVSEGINNKSILSEVGEVNLKIKFE